MKKAISIFTALTTVLWLSGVAMLAPTTVYAADISDGDVVREADEVDVYIIKLVGDKKFKRLILNPDVFEMYGHLNWSDVEVVEDGTLDAYETSTLVRAQGDDKVYKLYPDGDVGTKKWIDSLDCFTSQGFDWDSVYVINEFDRDSYTTADTTLCEEDEVIEGDITFSLASDTPEAETIPYNAQSVPFLKMDVDGSGTITQMVFERFGVGESADFDNVYLYEDGERLTSGRSVSSSTDQVTFIGLSVDAPTTLIVKGDLAADDDTNANHINGFKLVSASDVTTDATVGGSFPVAGNKLTISSIEGGKLTAASSGSIANPNVGENGVKLSKFKLTADNEPIDVHSLALYNGGTMNSTEITNLELKDEAGDVVATADTFSSDDIVTLEFDSPYSISKGANEIFTLYGDLEGDVDDTVILYFEVSADVYGIGQTYGSEVQSVITSFDETGEAHSLTLQGGELTISNNNPTATDVSDDTDDTVMMELAFTSAADVEVRKLTSYLCFYNEGSLADITVANEGAEVEDVKIVDKDTGTVLMGPTDGSSFTAESGTNVCGTTDYGMYKQWTDTWDLSAGETKNIQLTLDIAVPSSGANTDPDDQWKAIVYGFSNLSNPVKYTGTNDYVASADIVPSSNIEGNKMTIQTSSIDVAVASIPTGSVTSVKGEENVKAMALIFEAGNASDMELTDLVLTAFIDAEDEGSSYVQGQDTDDDSTYAKNVISSVTLYDADGNKLSGGGPKSLSGGTNDSDVTFDDLSWTIPAGSSEKMIVKVDVSTTSVSNNDDYVAFDIMDTTDVTAIDNQGNSSNSSSEDINGTVATSPDVYLVKSDGGTLTSAEAASGIRPDKTYVYQGQTGAEMAKFKFTSTKEAFEIDKIRLMTEDTDELKYFDQVELEYPVDADGTMVSTRPAEYFAGTASVTFDLTGNEMYVPKDDYAYVTVYADFSSYTDAGDPAEVDFGIDLEADDSDDFRAVGVGSSRVIEGGETTNGTIADATSTDHRWLTRAFPSFTLDGPSSSNATNMPTTILEFTVTNNGDYDLTLNETSGLFKFDVLGSGDTAQDVTFTLYKGDGTKVDAVDITDDADAAGDGTASCEFNFTNTTVTIGEGGSQSFYVDITSGKTAWDENGDYLQFKLQDEDGIVKWDDGGTTTQLEFTSGIKDIGIPLTGPEHTISGL